MFSFADTDTDTDETTVQKLNRQGAIVLWNLEHLKDDTYLERVVECLRCPYIALENRSAFETAAEFRRDHGRYPDREYMEQEAGILPLDQGEYSPDIAADFLGTLTKFVNSREAIAALKEGDEDKAMKLLSRTNYADGAALPDPLTGDNWNETPEDRRWLVEGWLPEGEITLLSGPGGGGKSILTFQLSTALAASEPPIQWLPGGYAPPLCRHPVTVVLAGWEDDRSEFLRRRHRMFQFGRCEWLQDPALNNRLHVLPMRGHGPIWGLTDARQQDSGELSSAGTALRAYCETVGARLLVIDPLSLALNIDENARAQVSRALESWAGWASECNCAVLFTGHPAKAKTGESSDYSGSTAWRSMVRSLWTLKPEQEETSRNSGTPQDVHPQDQKPAWTQSVLTLDKSNYGPSGTQIRLQALSDNDNRQDYLSAWGSSVALQADDFKPVYTPGETTLTDEELFTSVHDYSAS